MDVGPLRDLLTVLLGVGTGVLSGLFGVGGGVVSQPGMRLMGIEPLIVIGSALPVIIPGATSGARRYLREGLIRWPAVVATVPAGLVAAVLGSVAAEHVPGDGHLLQLATAALLGLSSWRMRRAPVAAPVEAPLAETDAVVLDPPDHPHPTVSGPTPYPPAGMRPGQNSWGARWLGDERELLARYVSIGLLAGLLSGLLGIGGGVIMVPAFVQLARMDVKTAIATSLVCVGSFAVPGTIAHVLLDHVDWRVVACLVLGVIPGARLGAVLTIRANDRRLRIVVATFLGATAVLYAVGEVLALTS